MISQGKKVFVGLSGGVDSAVSAALLKKDGYEVTGVFIKAWQPPFLDCTSNDDRLDAMRVAAKLNIPFVTLDFESEYKKDVVDFMISEYSKGRVPNPDVMCNRFIKFGAFYEYAMKNGADFVATGHYAEIEFSRDEYRLYEGVDKEKDQSYFIYLVKKEQLPKILFPVGGLKKDEVRSLAKKYRLPNALKKDSQGLCFMGKIDMKEFLSFFIPEKEGVVLDEKGSTVGTHKGAFLFTLGERHGFQIKENVPDDKPYYVISKNVDANTITISHRSPDGSLPLQAKSVIAANCNWFSLPSAYEEIYGRFRYRQGKISCTVTAIKNGTAQFEFKESQSSVSVGQSLVLYRGEEVLGGGIIESVL